MFGSTFPIVLSTTTNEYAMKAWPVKSKRYLPIWRGHLLQLALWCLQMVQQQPATAGPCLVVVSTSEDPGILENFELLTQTATADFRHNLNSDSPIAMPNVRPSGTLLDANALIDTSCGLVDSTIALLMISPLSTSSCSI